MRIGSGRHRSAHADQQAVDIWIDGHNLVSDPGTYRYSGEEPWRNAFTGAETHSAPYIEAEEGARLGRFLTQHQASARLLHREQTPEGEIVVTERPTSRGTLWRAVIRVDDSFAIVDAAIDVKATIRWNLDVRPQLLVEFVHGDPVHLEPCEQEPDSGWHSPHYGERRSRRTSLVHLTADQAAMTIVRRRGQSPMDVRQFLSHLDVPRSVDERLRSLE